MDGHAGAPGAAGVASREAAAAKGARRSAGPLTWPLPEGERDVGVRGLADVRLGDLLEIEVEVEFQIERLVIHLVRRDLIEQASFAPAPAE